MDSIGRIGLVMPEITDPLDYELLRGVHQQAKQSGLDVVCFTGIFSSYVEHQQDDYVHALENIYTLLCKTDLNGILVAAELFRNQPLIRKIYDYLLQSGVPCLSLGEEQTMIPFLHAKQRESIYTLTRHLIEVHKCKKIFCITGTPGIYQSEERLAGFRDAMQEYGLTVRQEDIFYGYFWKIVPEQIADQIAAGTIEKPDAIVCASDVMASALIERLQINGIRVPEDMLVTGYDGSLSAFVDSVTTVTGRDYQFGVEAVCRLYEMIFHQPCIPCSTSQHIVYGKSCGCLERTNSQNIDNYMYDNFFRNRIQYDIEKKYFMATNVIGSMSAVQTIDDWIANARKITHVLPGVKWLDVCLCEDWKMNFENPDLYRQYGYSDTMHLILSKHEEELCTEMQTFPTGDILPALTAPHDPELLVLTSLHYEGQIFGYVATAYRQVFDIHMDSTYMNWCDALANGLHILQNKQYKDYIHQKMELLSIHDPLTGLYNRRGLEEQFPAFLQRCRNTSAVPVLLLLTLVKRTGTNYDYALLSEGLRDVLDADTVIAQVHEDILAVLLPCREDGASLEKDIQEKIEQSTQSFRRNGIHPPQIIPYIKPLKCNKLDEIEAEIEQALHAASLQIYALEKQYTDYKEQLRELRRKIQSAPQEAWSIEEITKEIGISRSHLQRLYKELFQISLHDDLICSRMEKAKQLLLHTQMRIAEIATECGYRSEIHFLRQFKEKIGDTPTGYRKTYAK